MRIRVCSRSQSFAKVRQLDQYFELVVSTLELYATRDGNSSSASGWLFVSPAAQAALELSIRTCPAGQVQLLWNILSGALTLQEKTALAKEHIHHSAQ